MVDNGNAAENLVKFLVVRGTSREVGRVYEILCRQIWQTSSRTRSLLMKTSSVPSVDESDVGQATPAPALLLLEVIFAASLQGTAELKK